MVEKLPYMIHLYNIPRLKGLYKNQMKNNQVTGKNRHN